LRRRYAAEESLAFIRSRPGDDIVGDDSFSCCVVLDTRNHTFFDWRVLVGMGNVRTRIMVSTLQKVSIPSRFHGRKS
jgi:hypothetical protein